WQVDDLQGHRSAQVPGQGRVSRDPKNGKVRREGESPPFVVRDLRGSARSAPAPDAAGRVREQGRTRRDPPPAGRGRLVSPRRLSLRLTESRDGSGSRRPAPHTGPTHAHSACASAGGGGRRPRPRSTLRTPPAPTRARA